MDELKIEKIETKKLIAEEVEVSEVRLGDPGNYNSTIISTSPHCHGKQCDKAEHRLQNDAMKITCDCREGCYGNPIVVQNTHQYNSCEVHIYPDNIVIVEPDGTFYDVRSLFRRMNEQVSKIAKLEQQVALLMEEIKDK